MKAALDFLKQRREQFLDECMSLMENLAELQASEEIEERFNAAAQTMKFVDIQNAGKYTASDWVKFKWHATIVYYWVGADAPENTKHDLEKALGKYSAAKQEIAALGNSDADLKKKADFRQKEYDFKVLFRLFFHFHRPEF